jgi:hypothetical protein
VNTGINCGLVDARARTKGKAVDLSKAATITEDLAFTLVSSSGAGGSLAFGIPVFSGVSVGPSLSDLKKTMNTSQITNSFKIPKLDDLKPASCSNIKSDASWLDYVIVSPDLGQSLSRLTVGLEFYLSKSSNGSVSINVFALKIGPQFTSEDDKTQKACLTFDFEAPKPDGSKQETCQIGSSGGNQNKGSQ